MGLADKRCLAADALLCPWKIDVAQILRRISARACFGDLHACSATTTCKLTDIYPQSSSILSVLSLGHQHDGEYHANKLRTRIEHRHYFEKWRFGISRHGPENVFIAEEMLVNLDLVPRRVCRSIPLFCQTTGRELWKLLHLVLRELFSSALIKFIVRFCPWKCGMNAIHHGPHCSRYGCFLLIFYVAHRAFEISPCLSHIFAVLGFHHIG
jgi:hypothetical protein